MRQPVSPRAWRPAATGTDTGGSIRQPAALCGITGLKPTYGLVSRFGMIAFASSLDQAGPMAPSAEDCALLLNVMTGFDPNDSTSLEREKEDYTRDLEQPLAGLRVGLPREFFAEGLNSEVAAAVEAAVNELKKLGATTVEISLANSKLAIPVYYVLAPAEASSNLSRFDGVRYGYRAPDYADLNDMYAKTRAQGFGAEVKRRIMIGAYVLSHGYYDAYYLQAQKIRRLIADDFNDAFKTCDVILGPTAPGTAFKLGEKSDDPVEMYLNDLYTIPANLAGLPGMSLPCGFDAKGLPIGLQLVGNYFSEAKMLERRAPVSARHRLARPSTGGSAMKWETVIGLEVHTQLATRSKIFSGSSTAFGAAPNTQASAVDIALPGVLPVLNKGAVECAIKFGLAIGATLNRVNVFDRKNYFYPDLPKGYQISQLAKPIVEGGALTIKVAGG